MRKIVFVTAEIQELGIKQSFKLSVGPAGDVRSESPNCFVSGFPDHPMIGIEVTTDAAQIQRLAADVAVDGYRQAIREELADS